MLGNEYTVKINLAKGMSTRDIEKHLENLYAIDASPKLISRITDRIIPMITEWQTRPLSARKINGPKNTQWQ